MHYPKHDTGIKLAGASALATSLAALLVSASPAQAAQVIFTSQPGGPARGSQLAAGEQALPSGVTQLQLDDGTTVSIVGPARFNVASNGQLSVVAGAFTAAAPASSTPLPILAGGGTQVQLRPGGSANASIASDGTVRGFALTGSVNIASNGGSRSFAAGSAYRTSATGGPSAAVTAGIQPNGGTPSALQLIQLAQQRAAQYLANASLTSPGAFGVSGVPVRQNVARGTFQSATTPVQLLALTQAQTAPVNPAVALQVMLDILGSLNVNGTLGNYQGLNPTQIQALLYSLQTNGAPSGVSTFQLQQFLGALGRAGFTVPTITGNGPSFASLAELFALIASGGTIPPGDATVQALLNQLAVTGFPPGVNASQVTSLLALAGYSIPSGPGGTPAPTPTPAPSTGDGQQPSGQRNDIIIAYATLATSGVDQNVNPTIENGKFVGYVQHYAGGSTFPHRFDTQTEVESGGDQGIIGWARLSGGTRGLGTRGPNSGDHFIYGLPLANRPTSGIVTYDLIGATSPTMRDDSVAPGAFTGTMAVSFSATEIFLGLDAHVAIGGHQYDLLSTGGLGAPAFRVNPDGRLGNRSVIDLPDGQGPACIQGDCRVDLYGFLAGDGASHAGIAYTIRDDRTNNIAKWVDGTAAFAATGAPASTPTPTPTSGSAARANQSIVYAGNGISGIFRQASGVSVTYDSTTGAPVGLEQSAQITFGIGGATLVDGGSSGTAGSQIGWGRWVNGTASGVLGIQPPVFDAIGAHFISGDLPTNIPTQGLIAYDLIGSTHPVGSDGTVGTLDSGRAVVAFGAQPLVGLDMAFSVGGNSYTLKTPGGLDATAQNGLLVSSLTSGFFFGNNVPTANRRVEASSTNALCANNVCPITLQGYLTGDTAKHLGFVYSVGFTESVTGSAAFAANGTFTPGTGGGSTPATPTGTLLTNQMIAYSGPQIGIDARIQSDVTYDTSSGAPLAYVVRVNSYTADNEHPTIGTATAHESGSVASVIGWVRWSGGTTGGRFFSDLDGIALGANQGWHLISGTPATNLPTSGTVSYNLLGATVPTIRDGSLAPGSFAGNLAIAFGAQPLVGLDFNVSIGGNSYAFGTAGGAANPANGGSAVDTSTSAANSFFANNMAVSGSGPVCGGSGACNAGLRGFLAGDTASHVGVSFTFGNAGFDKQVDGVAAFAR